MAKNTTEAPEPFYTQVPDNSVEIWDQHPQWPGNQASLSQCSCRYKAGTQSPPGDLSRSKSCKNGFFCHIKEKAAVKCKSICSGFKLSVNGVSSQEAEP